MSTANEFTRFKRQIRLRVIRLVSLEVRWVFCFIGASHEIAVQQLGAVADFVSPEAAITVGFKSAVIGIATKFRNTSLHFLIF
jgi:hypothetical protein